VHPGFVKTIRDCLRATCRGCGSLLLTDSQRKEYVDLLEKYEKEGRDKKYVFKNIIVDCRKTDKCVKCGRERGKIDLDKPTTFRENGKKLTPSEIREWLEKISDDDLKLLGTI